MARFFLDYSEGARLDVAETGSPETFSVKISSSGREIYSADISTGMWCRVNRKYYLPYELSVYQGDLLVFSEALDLSGKKVCIDLELEDISEAISACRYVEEFRKRHSCDVICVSSHGALCSMRYPEISFVVPATPVSSFARYRIGRFYREGDIDYDMHRKDPSSMTMAEIAADILGIEYAGEGSALDSIVFYSDRNYEYQAKSLIESILHNAPGLNMYYYTIGFESSLEFEGLCKIEIPVDEAKPKGYRTFEFYKPSVLIEHLNRFGGKALFLDTDIIVGRRFDISKFDHDFDYPLMSTGNWSYPFAYEGTLIRDEKPLMEYFNVKERSMKYVYSNIISFSDRCMDFLVEWKSICDNQYLLSKRRKFFPFPDETAINIVLWKRGAKNSLGAVYLNTTIFEPFAYVEENDGILGDPDINYGIMGSDLLRCENSSNIMLYHGIKDQHVLDRTIEYFNRKKESI
jgi:hypothetical protein